MRVWPALGSSTRYSLLHTQGGEKNLSWDRCHVRRLGHLGAKRRASQFVAESDCDGSLKQIVMSSKFPTTWSNSLAYIQGVLYRCGTLLTLSSRLFSGAPDRRLGLSALCKCLFRPDCPNLIIWQRVRHMLCNPKNSTPCYSTPVSVR